MYILCKYVNCIYHYRGPHGKLAVTLCSYVFAKCCVPLKIKSLLTYLLYLLGIQKDDAECNLMGEMFNFAN